MRDDLISRKAAIDGLNEVTFDEKITGFDAISTILDLPSAEPKPCPFCGWGTIVDGGFLNHKCTCNSCGASTKGYATWELAVEAWNRRAGEKE